jgi:hypothetical protein
MIAREGHKISRIYIFYLYRDAPPQGDDKMSNRSSGTLYAYIDDQYNTMVKEKEGEREEKNRETNYERICVYMSIWAYQMKEIY